MIRSLPSRLLPLAALLGGCGPAPAASIDQALTAYRHARVSEAEAAFARIAGDASASEADRARALRETARIAWLIDGDAPRALAAVARAERLGAGGCDTRRLKARLLDESGRDEALLAEAETLADRCEESGEADSIRLHAVQSALDRGDLDRATALLAALSEEARAGLQGSDIALELALRRRDAVAALAAWRSYFWLGSDDLPPALRGTSPPAAELISAALAPDAAAEPKLALLDLLMRAGFLRQAQRFGEANQLARAGGAHPLWQRFAAYAEARRELDAAILRSNRRVARGGAADDLEAALERALARLVGAAGFEGERRDVLRRAYGLYGQSGNTGGFASVHYGHVVQNERRAVEQYGHRADVGFVVLDNMVANGFESWLWDGSAAAGGWTEPGPVIVQVRPGYAAGPLNAWALYSGAPARHRLLDRQGERAAADAAALREARIAYMPGLAARLRLQVAEQVGERARRLVANGGDLRRIFLDEYWRATNQQSILIHEGRHAIDRTLVTGIARLDDSNLEYRAKLSELALADYPRLALLNINDPTVGGDSPHGIANGRILRALAEWIESHAAEVRFYDPALPAAIQIDRLSDAQLRAIARSLDPILR